MGARSLLMYRTGINDFFLTPSINFFLTPLLRKSFLTPKIFIKIDHEKKLNFGPDTKILFKNTQFVYKMKKFSGLRPKVDFTLSKLFPGPQLRQN